MLDSSDAIREWWLSRLFKNLDCKEQLKASKFPASSLCVFDVRAS